MNWNEYIASFTRPTPPLAIVPRAPQAEATGSPVILCARYLGTREMRLPSGNYVEREMWSHAHFEYLGYTVSYLGYTYYRIRDRYGVLTLPKAQVRLLDNAIAKAA